MKLSDLLVLSMRRAEIPLRFEPGAEESLLAQVNEVLKAWLESHEPADYSQRDLLRQLLAEVEGRAELPE
jgi:hypothetical protein